MFSKRKNLLFLLIAPSVIYVIAISIYPAVYGLYISLTNMRLDMPISSFVGFANYIRLFNWTPFFQILANSFIFAAGTVALQIIIGLLLALALSYPTKIRGFMRSLAVMPWAWPAVSIGVLFTFVFSSTRLGILNILLNYLNYPPVSWLGAPFSAMLALILTDAWRGIAFATIMFLAALQSISPTYYEASKVDGAGPLQELWHITLPLITPVLLIVMIMASAAAFNTIAIVISLTRGGPGRATEVLALAVYKQMFENYDAGLGASIAVILLAINIILTVIYLRVLRGRAEVTL